MLAESWLTSRFMLLLLVSVRLTALCHTLPFLTEVAVTWRVRMAFACMLTGVVAPVVMGSGSVMPSGLEWTALPASAIDVSSSHRLGVNWSAAFLCEVVVGMSLGLSAGILLSGARFVAGMADAGSLNLLGGLMADGTGGEHSTSGRLFGWLALLAFFAVRGERHVLAACLDSFSTLPIGGQIDAPSVIQGLVRMLTESLLIGWRVALPIGCAALFGLVSVALLGRLGPMLTAIPALQLASVAWLAIALGGAAWMFSLELDRAMTDRGLVEFATGGGSVPERWDMHFDSLGPGSVDHE